MPKSVMLYPVVAPAAIVNDADPVSTLNDEPIFVFYANGYTIVPALQFVAVFSVTVIVPSVRTSICPFGFNDTT